MPTLTRRAPVNETVAFVAGSFEAPVIIFYSPQSLFCQAAFQGAEADSAMSDTEARLRSDRAYRALSPRGDPTAGFPNGLVFRTTDGPSIGITLYRPAPDDESRSFVVTLQPAD